MNNKMKRRYVGRRKILICISLILSISAIVSFFAIMKYRSLHFREGTYIQGVNCSGLTVKEAKEKIAEEEITFVFSTGSSYKMLRKELTLIPDESMFKILLDYQNTEAGKYKRDFSLTFDVKQNNLKGLLMEIKELKSSNMHEPKDAYMRLRKDGLVELIPEVYGNLIEFDEAYNLALDYLKMGKIFIDFSEITEVEPSRTKEDSNLISKVQKINNALKTQIDFVLADGSIYRLDKDIMKEWIVRDNSGNYDIDIAGELPTFLELLNKNVQEIGAVMKFMNDEGDEFVIPLNNGAENSIDIDSEIRQIILLLNAGGEYTREPIYENNEIKDYIITYIEIDKKMQRVRMYIDGICIVDTPCVTGDPTKGYDTPSGVFYLTYKAKNQLLTRYNAKVDYWMPFNGHIGMHDAKWRTMEEFVETTFVGDGSHGCVNLPLSAAEVIYENITKDMPIVVH